MLVCRKMNYEIYIMNRFKSLNHSIYISSALYGSINSAISHLGENLKLLKVKIRIEFTISVIYSAIYIIICLRMRGSVQASCQPAALA